MAGSPEARTGTSRRHVSALPLRAIILIAVLLVFGFVAVALAVVTGRGSQKLVNETIASQFTGRAELALQDLRSLQETAKAGAEALAANPITETTEPGARDDRLHELATVVRTVPGISAAYVGWPDGDFLLLRPVGPHGELLAAPAEALWVAQWTDPGSTRFDFLDATLASVESREIADFPFDPRTRPWFIDAMAADRTILTEPYVFYTTREPGISAARQAASGAVAGVDMSLRELSARLPIGQPAPSTVAALLTPAGGVLAHSDIERLNDIAGTDTAGPEPGTNGPALPSVAAFGSPVLTALAERAREADAAGLGSIRPGGREWITAIAPMDECCTSFVMAAPRDEIGVAAQRLRTHVLTILGIIALLTIPLVWVASRRLARPVETFSREIAQVAELDFASPAGRPPQVAELADLDASIGTMRTALGSYAAVCERIISEMEPDAIMAGMLAPLMDVADAGLGISWLADETGRLGAAAMQRSGDNGHLPATPGALADNIRLLSQPAVLAVEPDGSVCSKSSGSEVASYVLGIPLITPTGRLMGAIALCKASPDFDAATMALAVFVGSASAVAMDRPRLLAEHHYAASETESILQSVADGIHVLDAEGRIRRQNPAARAMLGWREEDILGERSHPLIHHHRADGRPYPQEACPIYATLQDGKTRRVTDEVFFRADGSRFPVEYECSAVRDGSGGISGAVVSFRDITERREAELALRERMKELRCLYRVLELTFEFARPAGDICREIAAFLPQSLQHEAAATARIRLNEEEFRASGWSQPGAVLGAPIMLDGEEIGFVEVGYRTEAMPPGAGGDPFLEEERQMVDAVAVHIGSMLRGRRMTEQLTQSEKLSAIGQLTGGIAHDFNNLLTVILGSSEMLEDSLRGQPELASQAHMVADAAESAAELARRLLAFGRRQALDPRPVDVDNLVSGMEGLLRRTLGEHIDLRMVPNADHRKAMIDPNQLENAIINLCVNARDAMTGGGELTIETANTRLGKSDAMRHTDVVPGPYVMVTVADTGSGMDEQTLQKVFDPYFTTKEAGKGSGLGLSMIYGFMKQSKGHVRIYSEPGEGTTVRLYLPMAVDGDDVAAKTPAAAGLQRGDERILVVEDNELVRTHVARQLTGLGYEVATATNGPEALEILARDERFDLLFSDVVMPGGMSGHELAAAAQDSHPGLRVLLTSGYTEQAMAHREQPASGMPILQKPYRLHELSEKIREALGGDAS